jgi:hypothetical protein
MQTTNGFNMTAVVERTAAVQASLFDDVVHVVDERAPAIPTCLNIAGCTAPTIAVWAESRHPWVSLPPDTPPKRAAKQG